MKLKELLEEPYVKSWVYYASGRQGLATAGAVGDIPFAADRATRSLGDLELCGLEYTVYPEFRLRLHFCDKGRNVYLYSPLSSIDQWMPDKIKALIAMEAR